MSATLGYHAKSSGEIQSHLLLKKGRIKVTFNWENLSTHGDWAPKQKKLSSSDGHNRRAKGNASRSWLAVTLPTLNIFMNGFSIQ